jgi:hypothetical protein
LKLTQALGLHRELLKERKIQFNKREKKRSAKNFIDSSNIVDTIIEFEPEESELEIRPKRKRVKSMTTNYLTNELIFMTIIISIPNESLL